MLLRAWPDLISGHDDLALLAMGHSAFRMLRDRLVALRLLRPAPSRPTQTALEFFSSAPSIEEVRGRVRKQDFTAVVYRAPGWTRAGLVVASELPRDRSTLLVRLLAGGRGRPDAMKDLSALPPDAPEHALATPVLLDLRSGSW